MAAINPIISANIPANSAWRNFLIPTAPKYTLAT